MRAALREERSTFQEWTSGEPYQSLFFDFSNPDCGLLASHADDGASRGIQHAVGDVTSCPAHVYADAIPTGTNQAPNVDSNADRIANRLRAEGMKPREARRWVVEQAYLNGKKGAGRSFEAQLELLGKTVERRTERGHKEQEKTSAKSRFEGLSGTL